METILFIIALVAIFAVKAFAIVRWHDDEIAKSTSFSWTKFGMKDSIEVPEPVAETPVHLASSSSWSPTLASRRLRANRLSAAR